MTHLDSIFIRKFDSEPESFFIWQIVCESKADFVNVSRDSFTGRVVCNATIPSQKLDFY